MWRLSPVWSQTSSGVAIPWGTHGLFSKTKIGSCAQHPSPLWWLLSLPHYPYRGLGLPGCFPAAAGLAGDPAPALSWALGLSQPPSSHSRDVTGEDGLTWPFLPCPGGAVAWMVEDCLITRWNGSISPEHPFRWPCGKRHFNSTYGNNVFFIRWVSTYFKKEKISHLSSRHVTAESALFCQEQSCHNPGFESTFSGI